MATTESTTTTIDLQNDVTIVNNTGVHKYKAGKSVVVPKESADDILRINEEQNQYQRDLLVKRTSNVDSGTFSVGNGAE